jgi:hypothetical protein
MDLRGLRDGRVGPVEPLVDLIVFLTLDPSTRMGRLRSREIERYGGRIAGTGDMAAASAAFLKWTEAYDMAGPSSAAASRTSSGWQRRPPPCCDSTPRGQRRTWSMPFCPGAGPSAPSELCPVNSGQTHSLLPA